MAIINLLFSDLSPAAQQRVLKTEITLNGRKITIEELYGSKINKCVDALLLSLIRSRIPIEMPVQRGKQVFKHNVPCKLKKYYINISIIKQVNFTQDILLIVIKPEEIEQLRALLDTDIKIYPENLKTDSKILVKFYERDSMEDCDKIFDICKKPVHCLQYKRGHFQYLCTKGRPQLIHENTSIYETITLEQLVENCNSEKLTLINEDYRMIVSNISDSLVTIINDKYPELFVIKIDFDEMIDTIFNITTDEIQGNYLSVIAKLLIHYNETEICFLNSMFKLGNVAVIFEGLETLDTESFYAMLLLVKYTLINDDMKQVYVTTPMTYQTNVEAYLNRLCHNYIDLETKDHEQFIANVWRAADDNVDDSELETTAQKLIAKTTRHKVKISTELPHTQLRMLAEIFPKYDSKVREFVLKDDTVNLADLYKLFIDTKVSEYIKQRYDIDDTKIEFQTIFEEHRQKAIDSYQLLYVDSYFTDNKEEFLLLSNEIKKAGDIKENEHKLTTSYAIISKYTTKTCTDASLQLYFIALFLLSNLKRSQKFATFVITQVLVRPECISLRRLINEILEKNNLDFKDTIDSIINDPDRDTFQMLSPPLLTSAREGNLNIIRPILSSLSTTSKETIQIIIDSVEFSNTLLQFLARNVASNSYEVVLQIMKTVVSYNANIFASNNIGENLLHALVTSQYFTSDLTFLTENEIKAMYDSNVDEFEYDSRHLSFKISDSSMLLLNKKNITEILIYFLDLGIPINQKTKSGDTLLHLAISNEDMDVIKLLVDRGADINAKNNKGESILHYVIRWGNFEIYEYLRSKNATIYVKNDQGKTLLHYAVSYGQMEFVKSLCLSKNVNVKDKKGNTALLGFIADRSEFVIKDSKLSYLRQNIHRIKYLMHLLIENEHIMGIIDYLVQNNAKIDTNNKNDETLVHLAIEWDLKILLAYLILNGIDVNRKNVDNHSFLHLAIEKGHFEIVKMLCENTANVHAKNSHGNSPIHSASKLGDLNILQYIVNNGGNINDRDKNSDTPLLIAAAMGHELIVEFLIASGANVTDTNTEGNSALHNAAKIGSLNIVHKLVENGAYVIERNKIGETVLHMAALGNNIEVVQYLHKFGASVSARNRNDDSVLMYALCREDILQLEYQDVPINLDIVKFLVYRGAHVNYTNAKEESPLFKAAKYGQTDVIQYLIDKNAPCDVVNNNGDSILNMAVIGSNVEVVRLLIANGADMNHKNRGGMSILHDAVLKNRLEIVKYLVEQKAGINSKINDDISVLDFATDNETMLKFLIEKGADVNSRQKSGATVIFAIAAKNDVRLMKYLIEKGSDINYETNEGNSLLSFAVITGSLDIVKYLIELNMDINHRNKQGFSVAHLAAAFGHLDVLTYLYDKGASLESINNDGSTLLFSAINQNHFQVFKYLVDNGAMTDKGGYYLMIALCRARKQMAEYLLKQGIDINNISPKYALEAAITSNQLDMVKFVIDNGANRKLLYKFGHSIMETARLRANVEIINYLKQFCGSHNLSEHCIVM